MKEVRSGLGTKLCVGWEEEGSKWWANVEPWGESAADLMVKEGPEWVILLSKDRLHPIGA